MYLCPRNHENKRDMATYTITLNERTVSGKALKEYLQALGVFISKVTPKRKSIMKRLTFTFLLTLIAFIAKAQTESNPGWLWTISGNGLAQKSYLFGTCHGEGHNFTKEEVFSFPGLQEAFDESKMLFNETELNPEHADTAALNKFWRSIGELFHNPGPEYMMPEGVDFRTLYDSTAHFKEVDDYLAIKYSDPEYWKKTPGYWFMRLGVALFIATRQAKAVDELLYEEAVNQGKETGGLEEMKDIDGSLQSMFTDTKGIDTLSMKEQADTLYRMIRDGNNGTTRRKYQRVYKAYISNDTCQFAKLLAENLDFFGGKNNSHEKELLNGRNAAWIPVIKENIAKRPCLIAVGCRHLLSDDGLIAMLRREGYTVEPVTKKY